MKKFLTFITVLLCALTLSAQETTTIDGLSYTIATNGTASVASYQSTSLEGAITIPSTINYNGKTYNVTALAAHAFQACAKITDISVATGIASYGENCFCNCLSLVSVNVPNGVKSIGYGCFENCKSMTNISFPQSVISIGSGIFSGCKGLKTADIQGSFNNICSLFDGCSSLISATIPSSVTNLESTFVNCTSLTTAPA